MKVPLVLLLSVLVNGVWEATQGRIGGEKVEGNLIERKKVKFIVFANPRSGSTWLGSLLASHKSVDYRGEAVPKFDDIMSVLGIDPILLQDIDPVLSDDYIEVSNKISHKGSKMKRRHLVTMLDVLLKPTSVSHVGFKWMMGPVQHFHDNKDVIINYVNEHDVRAIYLHREDHLQQCVSVYDMKTHMEMKDDHYRVGGYHSAPKARKIPTWWMLLCLSTQQERHDYSMKNVARMDNTLIVSYESLKNDESGTLAKIQQFLSLRENTLSMEMGNVQLEIHKGSAIDYISNWKEEMLPCLQKTQVNRTAVWVDKYIYPDGNREEIAASLSQEDLHCRRRPPGQRPVLEIQNTAETNEEKSVERNIKFKNKKRAGRHQHHHRNHGHEKHKKSP